MHVITQNSRVTLAVDLKSAYQFKGLNTTDITKTIIKFVSRTDGRSFYLGSHYDTSRDRWTLGNRYATFDSGTTPTGLYTDAGLGYFDIEFYASTVNSVDSTTDDWTRVLDASTLHPLNVRARDRVLRQRAYLKAGVQPHQFINQPTGTDIEPDIDVPTIVYL